MKTILVTGTNGLLGQKLIYRLLEINSFKIIAVARGQNRLNVKTGYDYYDIDITEKEKIFNIIQKTKPNIVINPAAMTNVDACENDKSTCIKTNIEAVKHLVEALENTQNENYKPHFIHFSTDFVFDGSNGPYNEEDIPNPISFYAESKLKSEEIVKQSKLKWAIVRTIIIYGVTDGNQRSNIVLWVKNSLSNGQRINVITDQYRSPTLAEDLANGTIAIAQKGSTGIYHLSGPDTFSIWNLAEQIADFWKLDKSLMKPVTSNELNQPAKRPPVTGFILDKAKKDLNYCPHTFVDGLKIVDEQLNQIKK